MHKNTKAHFSLNPKSKTLQTDQHLSQYTRPISSVSVKARQQLTKAQTVVWKQVRRETACSMSTSYNRFSPEDAFFETKVRLTTTGKWVCKASDFCRVVRPLPGENNLD